MRVRYDDDDDLVTMEASRIPADSKRGDGLGCRQHVHCRHPLKSGSVDAQWKRERRTQRLEHQRNA